MRLHHILSDVLNYIHLHHASNNSGWDLYETVALLEWSVHFLSLPSIEPAFHSYKSTNNNIIIHSPKMKSSSVIFETSHPLVIFWKKRNFNDRKYNYKIFKNKGTST